MGGHRNHSQSDHDLLDAIPAECIAVRVSILSRRILNCYNDALRPYDLRITQMFILVLTARWKEVRLIDLSEALQIDLSTLSRNVERIRSRGWVEWIDSLSGRGKAIRITPKGSRLVRQVVPVWRDAQKGVMKRISKKGAKSIAELLQSVGAEPGGLLGSRRSKADYETG